MVRLGEADRSAAINSAFKGAADKVARGIGKGMHPHDILQKIGELPTDLSPDELRKLKAQTIIGAAASASKQRLSNSGTINLFCQLSLIQDLGFPPEKARKLIRLAIAEKPGTGVIFDKTFDEALIIAKKKQERKK